MIENLVAPVFRVSRKKNTIPNIALCDACLTTITTTKKKHKYFEKTNTKREPYTYRYQM